MTSETIRSFRLLADHNQFLAFDSSLDPYDPLPEISEEAARRGWARTAKAIYYFTVGQLWDIRLDLFRSSRPPSLDDAQRVLSHTLRLPTGNLIVGNTVAANNVISVSLDPGIYSLFLRGFNLGVESDHELSDAEFLARNDLERYELFVIDGETTEEGVILGTPTLW